MTPSHLVCYRSSGGSPKLRIFKNRWFEKFARKQDIGDSALRDAIDRAERGLIDADLGGGVLKQRIARDGGGKSGGFRTIILFRSGKRAVFVSGFAKSGQDNLSDVELKELKKAARITLGLSEAAIEVEAKARRLMELSNDEDL